MPAQRLVVGLVRGVQGLRGALRVEILTDNDARFEPGSILHPEGSDRSLSVTSSQRDGPGLLVRFAEVRDRNAADALRGAYLEVEADGALPDDTFYWHDIIGCRVTTEAGAELGTVADVYRVGASEVYSVRGPLGEVLVPSVRAVVRKLDPQARLIVVDEIALGLGADEGADEVTDVEARQSAGEEG